MPMVDNKMKIALDLDGVLADVLVPWIAYNNTVRRTIAKHDVTDWMFWKGLKIKPEKFYAELGACWRDWRSIPPTEAGLLDATKRLSSLGQVDIVTAREPDTDYFVREWLAHHGIAYDGYVSVAAGTMKADLDYDVFIDDSPVNAREFVRRGKLVILYAQPWNKHIQDGIPRVANLSEAIREINLLQTS